jgi:hypothetical protein
MSCPVWLQHRLPIIASLDVMPVLSAAVELFVTNWAVSTKCMFAWSFEHIDLLVGDRSFDQNNE